LAGYFYQTVRMDWWIEGAFERSRSHGRRLRVRVGRGSLFDRVLKPLHPQFKTAILPGDAPYLECSQSSLVVHYFQWNIDSNSNNGPRLPKTRAAPFKRLYPK
jgi:hypothetical protein